MCSRSPGQGRCWRAPWLAWIAVRGQHGGAPSRRSSGRSRSRRQPAAVPSQCGGGTRRSPRPARVRADAASNAAYSNDRTGTPTSGAPPQPPPASGATNGAPSPTTRRRRPRPPSTTPHPRSRTRARSGQPVRAWRYGATTSEPSFGRESGKTTASKEGRIEPQPFTTSVGGTARWSAAPGASAVPLPAPARSASSCGASS